jgi:hypothetical protein
VSARNKSSRQDDELCLALVANTSVDGCYLGLSGRLTESRVFRSQVMQECASLIVSLLAFLPWLRRCRRTRSHETRLARAVLKRQPYGRKWEGALCGPGKCTWASSQRRRAPQGGLSIADCGFDQVVNEMSRIRVKYS